MNERLSLSCQAISSSHVFGPEGGVFGRSRKCDWVLPDEERILSSVHGRIILRDGIFSLVDESTNGIVLTGQTDPLGRGNSVAVRDGMSFMAGRYLIEARMVSTDSQAAAFGSPQSQAAPVANSFAQPSAQAPHRVRCLPTESGGPARTARTFSRLRRLPRPRIR